MQPYYLGKDPKTNDYYFFGSKDGVGRFIKYSRYPFWARAKDVSDLLAFQNPPQEVIDEVNSFVEGRLKIEVIPKVRGRAERVIKTEVPLITPLEISGADHVTSSIPSKQISISSIRATSDFPKEEVLSEKTKNKSHSKTSTGIGTETSRTPKLNSITKSRQLSELTSGNDSVEELGRGRSEKSIPIGILGSIDTGSGRVRRKHFISPAESSGVQSSTCASTEASDAGTRRVPESGLLGKGGGNQGSVSGPATCNESVSVGISEPIKSKRKRRTKIEMEALRQQEALILK